MERVTHWIMMALGFVLVVVLADVVSIGLGLKYWMPRSNGRTLNAYVYQRQRVRTDVLFVGSSRILRAATPRVVETELREVLGRRVTAYNVGQLGTRLFANDLLLKDLLTTNPAPEVVVVEVSVGALAPNLVDVSDGLRYYASLTDILRSARWIRNPRCAAAAAGGAFRGFANIGLYGHHLLFAHGLARGLDRIRARRGGVYGEGAPPGGRLSQIRPELRRKKLAFVRLRRRSWENLSIRIGGAQERALLDICRRVRDTGARLVVINPPVSRELREEGYPKSLRTEYDRYLRTMARVRGFVYRNLDAEITDLTGEELLDFGHLNETGSRRVSRYIARRVLAPLLAETNR